MYLITGVSGNVGHRVAIRLSERGLPVRGLTRDPERVRLPAGIEVRQGDLNDPDSLSDALQDVEQAFLILPTGGCEDFVRAAERQRLRHVVVLSATAAADPTYDNPMFRKHVRGEAAVRGSGLHASYLRPGAFASLTLAWREPIQRTGTVIGAEPNPAVPVIDPRDVADVAVEVLTNPDLTGRVHALSGPDLLTTADRVRVLAEVLRRPIAYAPLPPEDFVTATGGVLPDGFADALVGVERYFLRHPPVVLPTVSEITGRPARSFHTWASEHAELFRDQELARSAEQPDGQPAGHATKSTRSQQQ